MFTARHTSTASPAAGLLDRLQMRIVHRVFTAAMARLPAAAAQHRRPDLPPD
jgi:hypothetical protein